jgi:NhaA family Na+:H+ antiporter
LELKHELFEGQLAHPRAAVVPVAAALGGAIVPAGVFLAITWGGPGSAGWGVLMATDPAFAVGVLALLARRVPAGVRLLLLAIATVDDVTPKPAFWVVCRRGVGRRSGSGTGRRGNAALAA